LAIADKFVTGKVSLTNVTGIPTSPSLPFLPQTVRHRNALKIADLPVISETLITAYLQANWLGLKSAALAEIASPQSLEAFQRL